MKPITCLSNLMIDYSVKVDDTFLEKFGLVKGILNKDYDNGLLDALLKNCNIMKSCGGSSANVAAGIANLGGNVNLIGSVGKVNNKLDADAGLIIEEIKALGMCPYLVEREGKTGAVYAFITPDKERTFIANQGISGNISYEDLPLNWIQKSSIYHTSGYEFLSMKDLVIQSMEYAKNNNVKVSFDVACPKVVIDNKEEFLSKLSPFIDVLFANEEEARNLTGKDSRNALYDLSLLCDIVIIKLGSKGAYVKRGSEIYYNEGHKVNVANTNGAGDGFAAGFLYALNKGYPLDKALKLANKYASLVVQEHSARLLYKPSSIIYE